MKATLLALAIACVCGGQSLMAQSQQEVTYVEEPSQGYLLNRFKDNWFITGEFGGNIYFSHGDSERDLKDRFAPAAGLYIGKWFSPIIGARVGGNWLSTKSMSDIKAEGTYQNEPTINGKYKRKLNEFGPAADVMFNLTNWFCGYHPGRKYNFILYAGAGAFWSYGRGMVERPDGVHRTSWERTNDRILTVRAGIMNSFQLNKHLQLALDLRWNGMDSHRDEVDNDVNRTSHDVSAYVSMTYLFNKTDWSAPVVPVCPPAENCDALRARLEAAEGRIADLENQLKDALSRPEPEAPKAAALATIYYPINVYKLTKNDVTMLEAVSLVMKDNSNKHYVLTGWADNYTGNDQINTRLRHNRVNGVKNQLVKFGVPESQLTATINAGNLCDLGEKYVALDRAVTIEEGN